MTFERSAGLPAEATPTPVPHESPSTGPTPVQLRLQILSTEHWSLLASRSLAWPDLAPYFVMGVHDDPAGIGITMAMPPRTPTILHIIAATPFLVSVLNAVLAGAIGALVFVRFTPVNSAVVLAVAIVVAIGVLTFQGRLASTNIQSGQRMVRPMFPTPGADVDPSRGLDASLPGPGDRPGA